MLRGIAAVWGAGGREAARAGAGDLAYAIGPRINAAGRLSDMTLGIECLLTEDAARAAELAHLLDSINRERREVEAGMREQAEALLEVLLADPAAGGPGEGAPEVPPALCLYDPAFHEGVVGIVAGRLKDRLHRPTFVFARGQDGLLKGSGRSIPGFHLRDALDLVSKRHPGLLRRFGGHAMAAGCTLAEDGIETFRGAFEAVAREGLDPALLQRRLATDGPLEPRWFDPEVVRLLDHEVWGPSFEPPLFVDEVEVLSQRLVGERHLKLTVRHGGVPREAIWFGHTGSLPGTVRLAYRLQLDHWQGQARLQMVVEAAA
jgi:single-stranded-DNA-specific exonuclease